MKEPRKQQKRCFVAVTVLIMLTVSCFSVWVIDGAVQIDEDAAVLALFLIMENLILGLISRRIYRSLFSLPGRSAGSEGRSHE